MKKQESNPASLLRFRKAGLGDDLMVFWAASSLSMRDVLDTRLCLFFERDSTRQFLKDLSEAFPNVDVVEDITDKNNAITVRLFGDNVRKFRVVDLWKGLWNDSPDFSCSYHHKLQTEYGKSWSPSWCLRLGRLAGVVRAWDPPYPEIYDGLQEFAIALGKTRIETEKLQSLMGDGWTKIVNRLHNHLGSISDSISKPLLFPEGGSFQDFPTSFVKNLQTFLPDFQVARFVEDERPADYQYTDLWELLKLIRSTPLAITNDSVPSHLAQFFASKHILICTRSRPGNVCFPGAKRTKVVDLGDKLVCRPCAYYPLSMGECPAGYTRCKGLMEWNNTKEKKFSTKNPTITCE